MQNPVRVLIIVNLHAGKMAVKNKLSAVIDEFCAAGFVPTVRTTQRGGDAEKIVAGKSKAYDLVVCCGGDGTLNETISGMMRSSNNVPIGYIPCGSTNDMANTLSLPHNILKSTRLIIDGEPTEHDIGKFGDRYFTYIASFGAFTRASYATPQKVKNILGHFAYILAAAKEVGNIKPYRFRVEYNDEVVEDDFIFGSVSNSTSFGGVFSFKKDDVALNDGMFELLLIRNPKNPAEYANLVTSMLKRDFTNKNIIFAHTNRAEFTSEKELYWTIDGERSEKIDHIVIDNIPDTIRIVQKRKNVFRGITIN